MTDPLIRRRPRPKRARWYMQYLGECPVCGANKGYKEARYTRPPAKRKRYEYMTDAECYDWCNVL